MSLIFPIWVTNPTKNFIWSVGGVYSEKQTMGSYLEKLQLIDICQSKGFTIFYHFLQLPVTVNWKSAHTFHFHWLYIEVCFSHSWNCVSLSEIRLLIHRTHYKMHKSQIRRVKKYIRNAGYFFDFVFAAKHQASDYSLLQLCNTKTSLLYHLWCSCEKLFDKFIQSYQSNMSVLCNWISTL